MSEKIYVIKSRYITFALAADLGCIGVERNVGGFHFLRSGLTHCSTCMGGGGRGSKYVLSTVPPVFLYTQPEMHVQILNN